MLSVLEGGSLRLSCTSIGAPTPTIVWEMNGQPVQFNTTETITQPQPQFVGAPGGGLAPDVTLGTITSEILIINAQNHSENGVYTCIGSNDDFVTNSSALIHVQVLTGIYYYSFANFSIHTITDNDIILLILFIEVTASIVYEHNNSVSVNPGSSYRSLHYDYRGIMPH